MQPHQALWPFWCDLTSKRPTPPLRRGRLPGIGRVQARREAPRGGWHEMPWTIMAGTPSGGAPFLVDPHDHPKGGREVHEHTFTRSPGERVNLEKDHKGSR